MIDTHCHIYLPEFELFIYELLDRARAAGVTECYLPAIDSGSSDRLWALAEAHPGLCYPMAGLHPCSVKGDYESELEIVNSLLRTKEFIAIGETGLDLYWDKTFAAEQIKALEYQAGLALSLNLPIVLHTRNATRETIDCIRPLAKKGLTGVFHCFGGSLSEAREIIEMGFYLGIGGVITYKNSGLDQVVAALDLSHIVLETDSPYLSPVPFRGKRNEPSYLRFVAEKIAEVKGMSFSEVDEETTANARKLFRR